MLNIFQHPRTLTHFTILSGDVHYSFVYDVSIRHAKSSPEIVQITCSGFKNEFPQQLLPRFDRLDHWFYGQYSPLNWFTKRRRLSIRKRYPNGTGERALVNQSSLGWVILNQAGQTEEIGLILADGRQIQFQPSRDCSRRTKTFVGLQSSSPGRGVGRRHAGHPIHQVEAFRTNPKNNYRIDQQQHHRFPAR